MLQIAILLKQILQVQLHPWYLKTSMTLEKPNFQDRKYIFKWWIFWYYSLILAIFGVQVWLLCKISSFIFQKEKDKNRVCHCSYATGQLGSSGKQSTVQFVDFDLFEVDGQFLFKWFLQTVYERHSSRIPWKHNDPMGWLRGFTSNGCSAIPWGLALLTCLSITGAVLRYNRLREAQRLFGAYPKHPLKKNEWKESLHKLLGLVTRDSFLVCSRSDNS